MGPRTLLRNGRFLRVWITGGFIGTMRWLEILVIAVYTLEVTGSPLMVALMMLARALPMFLFGSIAGVYAERIDRRRIMICVLFGGCAVSAGPGALAQPLANLCNVTEQHGRSKQRYRCQRHFAPLTPAAGISHHCRLHRTDRF